MKQTTQLRRFNHHFRAMGTDVGLWLWNDNEQRAWGALLAAERFFAQTEARLSRFRPDSELSRLNRAGGQPFMASRMLFELVTEALGWREKTGGIFDPCVLNALIAYGYDRSFDSLQADATDPIGDQGAGEHDRRPTADDIRLGPDRQIWLREGVGLDLGGIAKGWTVQMAAHRLGMWGACLVDAGGDIACVGAPPSEPWVVSVADPVKSDEDIAVLSLTNEALATSSRVYRQWQHHGRTAHHLIDPRTGAPAVTNLMGVTVLAPRLPDAEIHAKTALILGEQQGLAYLDTCPSCSAILVTEDGRQLLSGSFEEKAYVSSGTFADRFRIPA